MSKVSVAFIDGHPIFLAGMSSLFARDQDFCLVGTGRSASDAVRIVLDARPDVLVIDIGIQGDAVEAMRQIGSVSSRTGIVAFSASNDVGCALKAFGAGAGAYVLKEGSVDELRSAVSAVARCETYIAQELAAKVVGALRSVNKPNMETLRLSTREKQIVELLLCGKTNKEIANSLALSDKTVKHYMGVLMQKFRVRNRLEVAIAAQRMPPDDRALHIGRISALMRH